MLSSSTSICIKPYNRILFVAALMGAALSFCNQSDYVCPAVTRTTFQQNLRDYVPNAGWIIADLQTMNLDDFNASWAAVVGLLCDQTWDYVNVGDDQFDQIKWRDFLLGQCHEYHSFLRRTFVDQKNNNQLHVFEQTKGFMLPENLVPLKEFWGSSAEMVGVVHSFYCFYCDRLSDLLVEMVEQASHHSDPAVRRKKVDRAANEYDRLVDFLEYIKGSRVEHDYVAKLHRLRGLIDRLKESQGKK